MGEGSCLVATKIYWEGHLIPVWISHEAIHLFLIPKHCMHNNASISAQSSVSPVKGPRRAFQG